MTRSKIYARKKDDWRVVASELAFFTSFVNIIGCICGYTSQLLKNGIYKIWTDVGIFVLITIVLGLEGFFE